MEVTKVRYGVPYQGSKNQIAREIVSVLPRGRRFVDLFAGGCAVTHAAILSGKYDTFLAVDLHGFGLRLFRDSIAGKYNGAWRQWVSRENFKAKKDVDPMIALCWSFSNNGRDYLYAADKEADKFAEHVRRCNGEPATSQGTRQCEALERLQALERPYTDYMHVDGDVVYCDPPYADTKGYNTGAFDNAAFWRWCAAQPFPVFVSEYRAPDGFTPIWTKGKSVLMNQFGADGKAREFVFVQDRFADRFQTDLFNCLF